MKRAFLYSLVLLALAMPLQGILAADSQSAMSDEEKFAALIPLLFSLLDDTSGDTKPFTIGGSPAGEAQIGSSYSFTPTVTYTGSSPLVFSITNKPVWLSFDSATGTLSGTAPTPVVAEIYRDVGISVSDGVTTLSLPRFNITVVNGRVYSSCPATILAGQAFSCQLPNDGNVSAFALVDAPRGFSIQPKTGIVHWMPTSDQVGEYFVGVTATGGGSSTSWALGMQVSAGPADPAGIYVAPDGDDSAAGTAQAPLKTLRQAVKNINAGDVIYLRGGVYYNDEYGQPFGNRQYTSMVRITRSGTDTDSITLRPHGNEYVKLVSDVSGLQFANAQHWIVDGIELEGMAQSQTLDHALAHWWEDSPLDTTAKGIATNASQYITVRNSVLHDFPGAGMANNGSDMITAENNVIYNNGWWSTGGVHGIANSYLTTVAGNAGKEGLVMKGNLVFANQSRIISHVFSKNKVELAIDEGNGLHAQNDRETFQGTATVANNVLMFNGKGGLGVNTMDNVTVRNNAFYQNAQVWNLAELIMQTSAPAEVTGNLFQPLSSRQTLKDSYGTYAYMEGNASTAGTDSADMPSGTVLPSVFNNPGQGDFSPAAGVPAGLGVPTADLQRMSATVADYGIRVQAPTLPTVDDNYLANVKQAIFNSWPADRSNIVLSDKATGYQYTYAQRCSYPAIPAEVACP